MGETLWRNKYWTAILTLIQNEKHSVTLQSSCVTARDIPPAPPPFNSKKKIQKNKKFKNSKKKNSKKKIQKKNQKKNQKKKFKKKSQKIEKKSKKKKNLPNLFWPTFWLIFLWLIFFGQFFFGDPHPPLEVAPEVTPGKKNWDPPKQISGISGGKILNKRYPTPC